MQTITRVQNSKFKAKLIFKASKHGQKCKDFPKKVEGIFPTVTFTKLETKVSVAAYTNKK